MAKQPPFSRFLQWFEGFPPNKLVSEKFKGIVSTYENQAACAGKLPKQFGDLQKDIDISIEKFNNSYNISELKGSKLKDLLYGSSLE